MFCFELQSWEQYSNLIEFEYNIKLVKTENAYSKKHLISTSRKRQHKKKNIPCWYTLFWPCSLLFLAVLTLGILPSRTEYRTKQKYSIASRTFVRHVQFTVLDSEEKDWGEFQPLTKLFSNMAANWGHLGWIELNMLCKKWLEKWKSYRYRFVPWIALNLRKRLDDPLFVYILNKPVPRLQYDILSYKFGQLSG